MKSLKLFTIALTAILTITIFSSASQAQSTELTGGTISFDLNEAELAGVGLTFSEAMDAVMSPSGPDFIGFEINARDAATNPTTFAYEANGTNLAPVSGTIESTGSISFNSGATSFGNIRLGFDEDRITGPNSGFFGESTAGTFTGIVFDISNGSNVNALASGLTIEGGISLSPELAGAIPGSTAGTNIGTFAIDATAAVPEPSSLGCVAILGIMTTLRRRRKSLI